MLEVSIMRGWISLSLLAVVLLCGCARETSGQQGSDSVPAVEEGTGEAGEAGVVLRGKRAVMIAAHRDFRDEELFEPRRVLEERGAKVEVASSSREVAKGALGGEVMPDLLVKEIDAAKYDAVVFVGGPGAKEYWDDEVAHALARRAVEEGKVVAAICIAPVTLAKAGVLRDRRATVWKSEAGRLKDEGAVYTGREVEVDGRIVTAEGPESAEEFGRAVARALAE